MTLMNADLRIHLNFVICANPRYPRFPSFFYRNFLSDLCVSMVQSVPG